MNEWLMTNITSKITSVFIITMLVGFLFAADTPPQRIITPAPNFTEILFALGLGDRVVGLSDFCHYPPEAMKKERIGGFLNPNLEKIVSLRPDLVIVPKTKNDIAQKLRSLKLHVLELPNETVADLLNAIGRIANATGVPQRGRRLRKKIETEIASLKRKYRNLPPVPTLIIVARSPDSVKDLYAAAPGTFLDELLTIAGGKNVLKRQVALYPKLSKESLIALNPQVILDTSLTGQNLTTGTLKAALSPWETLASIDAVKNHRIYPITNPAITIQGPRIAESARYIAHLLHHEKRGK